MAVPEASAQGLPRELRPETDPVLAPDEAIIDIEAPPLPARSASAYRRGGVWYVGISELARLFEMEVLQATDEMWRARRGDGGELVVDRRARGRDGAGRSGRAGQYEVVRTAAEWYVPIEHAEALFGVGMAMDQADLTLRVTNHAHVPAVVRRQRAAAQQAALARLAAHRRADSAAAERAIHPQRPVMSGLVLDYTLTLPHERPAATALHVSAGTEVLGGALTGSFNGPLDRAAGRTSGLWSWTAVRPDNPFFEQARVGRIATTGPMWRGIDGAMLTNAPYHRLAAVGLAEYRGTLDPGWQVEVYRGGVLVAVDTVDERGEFAVRLPVGLGENVVTFVGYGPHGERRSFERQYRVPTEQLPRGRFEYGLSAGRCQQIGCAMTGNLDLRYGLGGRISLQAGADVYLRDSSSAYTTPYLGLVATPTNATALEALAMLHREIRVAARVEPAPGLRLQFDQRFFADSLPARLFPEVGDRRAESLVSAFVRPWGRFSDRAFLEGTYARSRSDRATIARFYASPSLRVGGFLVQPFWRTLATRQLTGGTTRANAEGVRVTAQPQDALRTVGFRWQPALRFVGNTLLQVGTEGEVMSAPSTYRVALYRTLWRQFRMAVTSDWSRDGGAPLLTVQLTADRRLARIATYVTRAGSGSTTGNSMVQGSVAWDGLTRLRASAHSGILQSTLTGIAFLDQNGNGVWEADEPALAGVPVAFGGNATVTGPDGRYRLGNLPAFTPGVVRVDSIGRPDPSVVPLFETVRVTPAANRATTIDFPFVEAGTIEGVVERVAPDGRQPVAGATLRLTTLDADDEQLTVSARRLRASDVTIVTFGDGAFYVTGVRPGRYRLSAELPDLQRLGWRSTPLLIEVPRTSGGAVLTGLRLEVARARTAGFGEGRSAGREVEGGRGGEQAPIERAGKQVPIQRTGKSAPIKRAGKSAPIKRAGKPPAA